MRQTYEQITAKALSDNVILHVLQVKYGEARFLRKAYVCQDGGVQMVNDEGYSTVTATFVTRPKNCRYAVLVDEKGTVLLVDMYDLTTVGSHTTLQHREVSTHKFATVDAAIMYAVATY